MSHKILITTGIFEPEAGGPATFAPRIAGILSKAGWDVTVLTYSDEDRYDFDASYPFKLIRLKRKSRLGNRIRYFFAALKYARGVDFVYALDWFAAGLPTALACKILEKKYVARVGGDYAWEQMYCEREEEPTSLKDYYESGTYRRGIYRIVYEIVRYVLWGAQHVIFNSTEQRDLYCRFYLLSNNATSVVFNAIPKGEFEKVRRTGSEHNFVFWGRLNGMKNVPTLVRAFAQAQVPQDYTLTILGSGPQQARLEALVRDLKIEQRVKFLPRMRLHEVLETIKNARAFVLPSWTDISPNQIYEALAVKLPFLVTKDNYLPIRAQIPEMIDPHSVDDIAQKLGMLADDARYEVFAAKCNAITASRDWDQVLSDHLDVFKRVFGIGEVHLLQIGADRSKSGILYQESAAAARQKAYGENLDSLDIVGFSLKSDQRTTFELSPKVHVYPTDSLSRLFYGLDALELARDLHPNVISVQDPFETGLIAWFVALSKGVPLHVQVHTDFLSPKYSQLGRLNRLRVKIAHFVLRRASRIRVVSERIKSSIEYQIKPSAPITVLPIFTDTERFKHAPIDRDLVRRFSSFTKKVLVVSRLEPEKNVALAIRSFAAAAPKDACLIIVGSGTLRARLDGLVRELKIHERVFFETASDAAPYYKIADLVLVPSHYEGYGLVFIEALAAGKPVISTDVGVARQSGAIVVSREDFEKKVAEWFRGGPKTGTLALYPYKNFEEYARSYGDDIRACIA